MPTLDELKKKIEEKKGKRERKTFEKKEDEMETIDMSRVEAIVKKMKQKYAEQGLTFEAPEGKLAELKGIITDARFKTVDVQSVEMLKESKSPAIRGLSALFLRLKDRLKPMVKGISKLPQTKELAYYMYSANMKYTLSQYIALTVIGSIIGAVIGAVVGILLAIILAPSIAIAILLPIIMAIMFFIIILATAFYYPKMQANKRGTELSSELPFALRHMSTQLKSGVGLFRTLQSIASADYGVLSEEFSRTINEIEEGTETRLALKHFALRTQSQALANALTHMIRALKTGGNLSSVMMEIAQDTSFELRAKMREFAEKMNFFGVIFIIGAIVGPVFVSILAGIRNAPLGQAGGFFSSLPLGIFEVSLFYLVVMPAMLIMLIFFLLASQPKI